ncbi:hypothetical protein BD779DRAFT_766113 [Infundibulicybe gibba]|nr:hypothetical protein BD779DRAFT_766113 [Infundibulicybe gibba]
MQFKTLNIAVVGGGLGGLSAALALRRAGHRVTIYERRSFAAEVGASISCAANGGQWLAEWGVDIDMGRPVNLLQLTMRDWKSGEVLAKYDLHDYEEKWGQKYYMFYRKDMHTMLLESCTSPEGKGFPVTVHVDYVCESVDYRAGRIKFRNGQQVEADMIIGADGIRSRVRSEIGITPQMSSAPQTCFRCNVSTDVVKKLNLVDHARHPSIQFWGGFEVPDINKYFKIVMSPCAGGDIVSFYCFMPTEFAEQHTSEGFQFKEVPVSEILVGSYDKLDKDCVDLLKNSVDRMPWRLYVHDPYPYWSRGIATILGDAAHPMMSQGACQAIEDAAALGLIFSADHPEFTHDVAAGLALYERIRKPRATRVQAASMKATENLAERIGFTSLAGPDAPLVDSTGWQKLTVAEMNTYNMRHHIAQETRGSVEARL